MIETGNDIEQRRLSAAGRPDDAYEFPIIDRKRDAIDRQGVVAPGPEMAGDPPQSHQPASGRHPLPRGPALLPPRPPPPLVACFPFPTAYFLRYLLGARQSRT